MILYSKRNKFANAKHVTFGAITFNALSPIHGLRSALSESELRDMYAIDDKHDIGITNIDIVSHNEAYLATYDIVAIPKACADV